MREDDRHPLGRTCGVYVVGFLMILGTLIGFLVS